jgi:release factor glutamine methyltransferase
MPGSTDFGPLTLKCRAPTLIPRPETAEIFRRLASLLSPGSRTPSRPLSVVDLCTGSAPIPLLLRHHLGNRVRVKGYDFSEPAIELAKENISSTGVDVEAKHANILDESFPDNVISDMDGRVDLIVSNPPYIPLAEYRELPASVREWEDPAALLGDPSGGESGLRFYERIAELLPALLESGKELEIDGWRGIPRVAVEIGSLQGRDVSSVLRAGGMGHTEVWQDQYDKDRMVVGWD